MASSTPDLVSSSEIGVNPGIRSWKTHLAECARCQKAIGCIYFTKKVKSWDSTTCFRIWQFQTPAWKRYLRMHLLAERFVFWGLWSRFSKSGNQCLSNDTNAASKFINFFMSSHLYSIICRMRPECLKRGFLTIESSGVFHLPKINELIWDLGTVQEYELLG